MGNIRPLGDPAKHFWLSRSVARAMGVSLSEAMAEGQLSANGYADLVTRCRMCSQVSECQQWLAQCGGQAETTPGQCMHKAFFEQLAERR